MPARDEHPISLPKRELSPARARSYLSRRRTHCLTQCQPSKNNPELVSGGSLVLDCKNLEMQSQQVCPKEGLAHHQLNCCSGTRTAWSLTRGSETYS